MSPTLARRTDGQARCKKNSETMHNHSDSDVEIVRRVIEGDVNAYEHLLKKYKDYVFKIVNKHIPYDQVEETAHDVFIRAYQSLPKFKNKGSFKQWLARIAVRTCYDFWRKTYRSRELPMSSLTEKQQHWVEKVISDQSEQSFSENELQKEAREVLDYALDRLSPEDRMVLELIYLKGLSGKEAAELLGWSIANVKIRLFRSRKKLHKLLTGFIERQEREI
ncbi:RNA polymerase sigma factor [Desulfonema magnum]|uniref:RNA polymerase sigma-E factor (Sigma24) n=1 Tax=Desulfonema magnum TaxID=45655 RepID=A0A975BS94_9BACT|nr:RNA polymerase sigma factor [Desulfonema magnum]QTA90468.1 RNA polymerase sigma-E factor (sigma24) [Desulfonema magnum]